MKRLGRLGHCVSLIAGATIGTFCFLTLAVILTARPIREAILSAHGILASAKPAELSPEQSALLTDLVQKGALITSNDLLTNVSSFYSTMISVLIATFFVFGALSFFAVQANAKRQIEDIADVVVTKAALHHFESLAFDKEIREKIDSSLQLELESYDALGQLQSMAETIELLEQRVNEIRANAPSISAEE